jgi:hypothetical protein
MNLILQNSGHVEFYTFLDPIFTAVPQLENYFWMISNIELGNQYSPGLLPNEPFIGCYHVYVLSRPILRSPAHALIGHQAQSLGILD